MEESISRCCTTCKVDKPIDEFGMQNLRGKPYRRTQCKQCARDYAKARYDPEVARAKYAAKKSDPGYVAARRKRYREWRAQNPEKANAATDRWRAEHPEKVLMMRRANSRARRVKMRGVKVDYDAILAEHGMFCHICSMVIVDLSDLHFDHVIPLSRGGEHSAENIRPAHAICNLRKGSKLTA